MTIANLESELFFTFFETTNSNKLGHYLTCENHLNNLLW